MQQREKLLAAAFGTAILLMFGGPIVSQRVFGPFGERAERLKTLNGEVATLTDQALELARARKNLTEWKGMSLPPDRDVQTSSRRPPTATDAQRLYQAWLTDLAHLSGLDGFSVKPDALTPVRAGRGSTAKYVYIPVVMTIETEGRFSQLCSFLDHFYRAKLLHRISNLKIDSRESEGDPILKMRVVAEGLALVDAPWRRTLFPETRLQSKIDDKATTCTVEGAADFPKKTPFRVRFGTEYANVTAVDGNTWTLERGVDRTFAANHAAMLTVEHAPVKADVPSRSVEEFREILKSNIFIKPPPPKEYRLKVGPLAEQAFARGESLAYTIPVSGYDPTLGKPEFVLKSTAPPGLELERGIGKVTWKPAEGQPIGKFPLQIEVRHPSASNGTETAKLDVVFREPNSPPTVTPPESQTAYLGRQWTLPLKVSDVETSSAKLSLKLENPPEGVTLDPATQTLQWSPPPTTPPGEVTINVVVTDDGTPAKSKSIAIPVKVADDDAMFTYLTGAIAVDGEWQAWFHNRAQGKKIVVRVGDELHVSDINGTVKEIGQNFVILKSGETEQRLQLGQNLRELPTAAVAPQEAATKS